MRKSLFGTETMVPFSDKATATDDDHSIMGITWTFVKPALCASKFYGVKSASLGNMRVHSRPGYVDVSIFSLFSTKCLGCRKIGILLCPQFIAEPSWRQIHVQVCYGQIPFDIAFEATPFR